nr:bifunctional glycosyltransferase/CDP-glycerol:glycerophosphate glycerophosphotransferase [Glycomyces sp. L485]
MSENSSPRLSVVVPVYNVQEYLDQCLSSVAEQNFQDFEVVMVDDGSTDTSPEIAGKWAESDARFRLVRQENHGLGHARNTGLQYVSGEFLAFLDSDDTVPVDGYERMIGSLEHSGSDFAVGNVERFDSGRSWQTPQYAGLLDEGSRTTHILEEPALLRDTLAHNKVWRTEFWRRHGFEFPVGVYYEDIPIILPAHLSAERVDLVDVVAVNWRLRESGDSITQRRAESPAHFTDRFDGVVSNIRFFEERGAHELARIYGQVVLERDFYYAINTIDQIDDEYRRILRSRITRFLNTIESTALEALDTTIRMRYRLLCEGDIEELVFLRRLERAKRLGSLPVVVADGRAYLDLGQGTDFDALNVDKADLDTTDDLELATGVTGLRHDKDDIVIEGWAYIRRLAGVDHGDSCIRVWAEADGKHVDAELDRRDEPLAAIRSDTQATGIEKTGFSARLPVAELVGDMRRQLRWTVNVSASIAGVTSFRALKSAELGTAERVIMRPLGSDWWLRASWVNEELLVRAKFEPAVLESAVQTKRALQLRLRVAKGFNGSLELRSGDGTTTQRFPFSGVERSTRQKSVTIPHSALALPPEHGHERYSVWRAVVVDEVNGRTHDLNAADGFEVRRKGRFSEELFVRRTKSGVVRLWQGAVRPTLESAEWTGNGGLRLHVEDPMPGSDAALLLRLPKTGEALRFPMRRIRRGYTCEIAPAFVERFGATVPIRRGWWTMGLETGAEMERPVAIKNDPRATFPIGTRIQGRPFDIIAKGMKEAVLVVGWDIADDEVGKTNQWRLQQIDYPESKGTLRDAVLYEVFRGQSFADSPREIFEELQARGDALEHFVVSDDQQVSVPEGARAVAKFSREYYRLMAQCRYIVASTHLPEWFEKAPGQIVVQTWHGTPLKRIGLDIDEVQFANPFYRDRLVRESAMWDHMISASDYTTPIMRSAFGYEGSLLETGLPRNDRFYGDKAESLYSEVRERLRLPGDRKIVLYAPTWRDTAFGSRGRYTLDLQCDLRALAESLGDGWSVLFRKHANVTTSLPDSLRDCVVDVSEFPDVQDLLCASDILITDYSSLMFDYANTGRPMLFYTYDLEQYRDQLRGFYFDFEAESPGPLLEDEDSLRNAMTEIDRIKAEYEERYRGFRERFCTWDDGAASARVIDAVFGETNH